MAKSNFIPKTIEERSVMESISTERGVNLKFSNVYCTVPEILDGAVFYAEFSSKDSEEDFVYVFKSGKRTEIFEDGVQLIHRLLEKLSTRRTLIQRMKDFTMTEMVCAAITICLLTGVIVTACVTGAPDKELISMLSLVIGYYFGRHTGGK